MSLFSIGGWGQFFSSEMLLEMQLSGKLESSAQHFGIVGSQCES
jgi:hypothetical protein